MDFSVDYDPVAVEDILTFIFIFNEKEWHNIKCLDLFKNAFYSNGNF